MACTDNPHVLPKPQEKTGRNRRMMDEHRNQWIKVFTSKVELKHVTRKGYLRTVSPPFLHSSPTQKAAFLLLVASGDPNSLSTKGINLCKKILSIFGLIQLKHQS